MVGDMWAVRGAGSAPTAKQWLLPVVFGGGGEPGHLGCLGGDWGLLGGGSEPRGIGSPDTWVPPDPCLCPPSADPALLPGLLRVPDSAVHTHHVGPAPDCGPTHAQVPGPPGHAWYGLTRLHTRVPPDCMCPPRAPGALPGSPSSLAQAWQGCLSPSTSCYTCVYKSAGLGLCLALPCTCDGL